MSLKIAAKTDVCSFKVAILFSRERSRSKRVRAVVELTRAVESAPARALLS